MSQPLALPNYSALGSLVTKDDDFWSARKSLVAAQEKDGWRYLGQGATASAYLSPCGSRVLKLVRGDDGNRATLDAALAHPDNPHLPTVYGFLNLQDGHFAVELERLENQSGEHSQWETTWSPGRGVNVSSTLPSYIRARPDCPMKEAIKALHAAAQDYPSMCWDCHGGNIMVRPGTGEIVLNDLLYGEEGADASDDFAICERCDTQFDEAEGGFVDGCHWCDRCIDNHAVFCEHEQEFLEADDEDVKFLGVIVKGWLNGAPWGVIEGKIAASNREAFADDGNVWVEEAGCFVEPNLYAVLSAIESIAREVEADCLQPRLPFALAA